MATTLLTPTQVELVDKNIAEADTMFKKCKALWFGEKGKGRKNKERLEPSAEAIDELYNELRENHREFVRYFSIVVEYMVTQCEYSEKSFRKMIKGQLLNPGKGLTGINEWQAKYAKFLYQENYGPHYDSAEAKRIEQHVLTNLEKTRKETEESYAKAVADKKAADARRLAEKKAEMLTLFGKGKTPMLTQYP